MPIFKSYDVRGVYPKEWDEHAAYAIGNAFARFAKSERVIIARDVRKSSSSLSKAFIKGVIDAGVAVTDLGMCTTPLLQFAAREWPAAMITASHNPKQYNGIKFYKKGSDPISYDSGLDAIEKLSQAPRVVKKGRRTIKDFSKEYIVHVASLVKPIDPQLRIVIDASNGSAGLILPQIIFALKLKHVKRLYWTPDGNFPNHPPDPLHPQSIKAVKQEVKKFGAHFGALIDADADRVVFVDDKGNMVRPEHVLIFFARMYKSPKIVHDLRMGWVLREELRKLGAESIRSRVGRTHIYHLMKAHNAHVGAELSGHYYFRDNNYCDDGLVALLRIASIVSQGLVLSEALFPLSRYASSGELNFEVSDRQHVITNLYNLILAKFKGAKIDFLDGLTAEFKDWWFNVRPSNTQPVLRLIVEAKNTHILEKRVRFLKKILTAKHK